MASQKQQNTSFITTILETPWHFAGLTIVFIFNGYLQNPDLFQLGEVLLYAAIATAISIAIFLMFKRVLMVQYAGLMTFVLVFLFFIYGNLNNLVVEIYEVNPLFPSAVLTYFPIIIIGSAVLIFVLLLLQKREFVQVGTLLNVITISMLVGFVFNAFTIFNLHNNLTANQIKNPAFDNVLLPLETPESLPDVYYIIVDAYPNNPFLQSHFGIDNSDFTDQLEELGFFVAENSVSNYTHTKISLPSSLNMQWIQELASENQYGLQLVQLIMDNLVAKTFQEIGYDYVVVPSGIFFLNSTIADLTISVDNNSELSYQERGDTNTNVTREYLEFLLESTFLQVFTNGINESSPFGTLRTVAQFDALKSITEYEQPTFTFFHILKPHAPVVFNSDGTRFYWSEHYANITEFYANEEIHMQGQLEYTNQLLLDALTHILETSEQPPIIIIQGDHGMRLSRYPKVDVNYPIPIMNAYYFPDGDYSNLSDDTQPINTFRIIFDQYFNIPYETLPQASYFHAAQEGDEPLKLYPIVNGELEPPFTPPEDADNS